MATKIEIIENSLVITKDGELVKDLPKQNHYYNPEKLLNDDLISIYCLQENSVTFKNVLDIPLSEAVDSTGLVFDKNRFQSFCRKNLGFKTALGGSSADLLLKTDKGGYTGTAQDLKNAIDGALVPIPVDILVVDEAVGATFNIDWSKDTFDLTRTADTTFTESNLPPTGFSKTITIHESGNFALTYPNAGWSASKTGERDGTKLNTHVIEYYNGKYKRQITQPT